MKNLLILISLLFAAVSFHALPIETKGFRLLSVADAPKLILVSEIPSKTKYMLDVATAKITVDGKPAEFKDLRRYALIHVTFTQKKAQKEGVEIDGVASEIKILTPENQNPSKL